MAAKAKPKRKESPATQARKRAKFIRAYRAVHPLIEDS